MSNIRKALENENVSEDKIKEILNELGIKESKRWAPEIDEVYWTTNHNCIKWYNWTGNRNDTNELLMGNVFRTEQEAQHHLYKTNFLAQMEIDFEDNSDDIDWSNKDQVKYYIYIHHFQNKIGINAWSLVQHQGILHTTNLEWLEQYIKDHEEDIKKYCFGIE